MRLLVQRSAVAALVLWTGGAAAAQEPDEAALHAAVLDVIERKCSPCHAPGSEDEDALKDWDCSHDLAATLAVPHLVEAGDPEASDIFLLVDDGDMPPEDWADGDACSAEDLEALRAWIAAGAPLPEEQAEPLVDPWSRWVGNLHPATVHFPIALLIAALLADLCGRRPAARFCLGLGALGAVAAAWFGWVFAETKTLTAGSADELFWHRWTGVVVAALALVTWIGYVRRGERPVGHVRWLLVATAIVVALAGHQGGDLSWGAGHLTPPFLLD